MILIKNLKYYLPQNTCLNDGDINLVQFLQEIASEQVFEVTYVDIEEKSISGKLISNWKLNHQLLIVSAKRPQQFFFICFFNNKNRCNRYFFSLKNVNIYLKKKRNKLCLYKW